MNTLNRPLIIDHPDEKKKHSDLAMLAMGIFCLLGGMGSGGYLAYQVGIDKGVRDVYLDFRDRGFTVLHGAKYECGPPSNSSKQDG